MNAKAITETKPLTRTGWILLNVGAIIFFFAGLAGFWFITISPLMKVFAAGDWPQVECVVTSSQLKRHAGDDGDTWSAEISFRYEAENKSWQSDSYSFYSFSGNRGPAKTIVDAHPVGKKTRCFYNPNDPATAVINRDFHWVSLFGCLFLLMTLGGALTLYFVNRSRKTVRDRKRKPSGENTRNHKTANELFSPDFEGPQQLKPDSTRLGRLLGISFFALIWNSIVGAIGYSVVASGAWDFCTTVFIIPFALAGLALMGAVLHQLLAMTNPVVVIALSNGTAVPGETIDVAWETRGRASRMRKLTIVVEGIEEASYTRGTDRITDEETFCYVVAADVTDHATMEFGSHSVEIPLDSLPSFEADNNKIIWSVKVSGEIPFWPDVKEEFPFRVRPA